jgi:protein-disulfide isomerase
MASRTKQKEEARERRLAEERARAERQARMRRLRGIAGIVVAAVVVVVVAIAISSGGGGSSSSATGLQKGGTANQTVASVNQLLAGVPQSGAVLGNPNAPVTMTYYGDLECPVCRDFTLNGGFPQLVANEVRQGKVKVEYRAFQTATRDAQTFQTQQVAALAAGEQNKFWDYAELFYNEQGQEDTGYVTNSYLTGLAQQVPGLNLSEWQSARNDQSLVSHVQSDVAAGATANVQGTPTLIFTGPKGTAQPSSAVPSYSDLQQAIKQVS